MIVFEASKKHSLSIASEQIEVTPAQIGKMRPQVKTTAKEAVVTKQPVARLSLINVILQ